MVSLINILVLVFCVFGGQLLAQDIPTYTLEPDTTTSKPTEAATTTAPQKPTEEVTDPPTPVTQAPTLPSVTTTPAPSFPPVTTTTVRPAQPNDPYQCCLVLKSYWMFYGYKTCCFLCCKIYFGHKCKPVSPHLCYNY